MTQLARPALAAVLAAAGTLALVTLSRGHAEPSVHMYTAPHHAFTIAQPAGWSARGSILRRADGLATVVVRRTAAPVNEPLSKLAGELTRRLRERFADFRPVSARLARTRAGAAFLYTFARTRAGLVQSIMVARVGGRTYSLYALAPAASPGIARQTGAILSTFGQ